MDNLIKLVEKFSRTNLLVVGDLMLDRFIRGEVERISPEAPVPVVRVLSESTSLGGAANVVHNVRSLGGRVTACGIVGQDDGGRRVIAALRKVGASTAGVCVDRGLAMLVDASPDSASLRVNGMLTLVLFQPLALGAGEGLPKFSTGGVASRFTVTEALVVPPEEVVEQVSVTPLVSVEIVGAMASGLPVSSFFA